MTGRPPTAAVLILHGGYERGLAPPPPGILNLPGLRMVPITRAVARAVRGSGVRIRVRAVRYTHRGWNGRRQDPLHDTLRALDALRQEAGDIPVILLGHSMGARAALRAAGHPLVRSVVGLAPWCPAGDPVAQLAGRDVVLLHSTRDRVTSPDASQALTARARHAGARTCLVTVPGSDHAMLRRAPAWHHLTATLVRGLLGLEPLPDAVATALELPVDALPADGTMTLDSLPAGPGGSASQGTPRR
ncbi:alpha/beta fold hydrolase [Streptomyces sp. B1I3]|uniref:alpha/beta fold hydrolase n=1 Tax=Streptomyces sp. B1I3 TaxID=3042264 RepID=UPI00278AD943|nr:alpha/beta fold hydrolase [Streptomyces sp. B1I3]MDQ0795362.1 pimeloyl-ACP methyl ester carboxylesterase [Streptomyces sp. B1I3]